MSKKLVSDLLVDYLERRGVTKLFGLCGHTVIGMLDALSRSKKIEYIGTRHEAVASTAADGYARITHKASVVMCHLGPGLTNVITGVANASLDSIPMVVIAGDVPSYYFGRHPHQEIQMHEDGDQYSMLKPVCKRSWRVDDVEALPYILDKAFRLAEAGRPGPVLVDVPMDMFSREMEEELWARTYKDSHVTMKPALDPAAAKAIAKKLVEAKNPVLHAGGGTELAAGAADLAQGCGQALLRAAEDIVHVVAGDVAELPALVLGVGHELAAAGAGDADYLLLVHQGAGLFLGGAADGLRLLLGVADELVTRGDEALGLRELHGQLGLDVLYHVEDLVPLNYALVVAQGHSPGLGHHGVQLVYELHDLVVHFQTPPTLALAKTSSIISRGKNSERSAP